MWNNDSEVGNLIAAWLGKNDFRVTVEQRGDRALEVIEAHAPDLVLLDILLLGKDSMTLCRDLRPRYASLIVLLTSLDSDMNYVLALEMGANDYILKTTPPAVLLARVRLHLRQNSVAARAGGRIRLRDTFWSTEHRCHQSPGYPRRRHCLALHG